MYQKGEVKRTGKEIKAALPAIKFRAGDFLDNLTSTEMGSTKSVPEKVGARSLRRWTVAYEQCGLGGLFDRVNERGNHDRRMTADKLMLMTRVVNKFQGEANFTQQNVIDDVRNAFDDANIERREAGRPEIAGPSRETIRKAIIDLDPFQTMLGRDGQDVTRNALSPVGRGIETQRPLERVEIDEWTVDAMSLMAEGGLLHHMTIEEKELLGLDRKKARWTLTVAICVRTRCIVGMVLSRNGTAKTALRVMDMIMRDKGVWSDAVGALTSWNQFGWPSMIVTDCGKNFISEEFRFRAKDAGITLLHTPAANPRMKPYIERVFRTMSINLMPRLTGRTFANIIEKGDRDPSKRAALTADDFCSALVRWVVDIYHRTPHKGLNGETPLNCWNRLTKKFGVQPPPDLRRRRLVFGEALSQIVSKEGISVLGIRYHCERLARWMLHSKNRQVNIRWYPEDIGAIAVEIDDQWIEVAAVFDGFAGVSAQSWLCAARMLRASNERAAEVDRHIVRKTLAHIDALNGEAMRRIGLVAEHWSQERIDEQEDSLFIGFRIADTETSHAQPIARGMWGHELQTAVGGTETAVTALTEYADTVAREIISAPTPPIPSPIREARSSRRGPGDKNDDTWTFEDKS